MRTLLLPLVTLALLLPALLVPTLASAAPIDETLKMAANGLVDLEFVNTSVRISGSATNEFHIKGELNGDEDDAYDLHENNGNIRFEEHSRHHRSWNDNWHSLWNDHNCWNDDADADCKKLARVEISIPEGAMLRLENVNGAIWIENLHNNISVNTTNGDMTLSSLTGTIKAESINGAVDANSLQGRVSLETINGRIVDINSKVDRIDYSTVNGDIDSNVVSDDITVETVNGDMELALPQVRDLEITTVGGRVDVDAALTQDARVDISSVHGRINLAVPASSSARFKLNTQVNGRINNQLTADTAEREKRYVNSSELSFTLGDGNADVDISTVSGNITLRKQ
jgi:DUF4097 and DUF4098 domain-containing protein YvlB